MGARHRVVFQPMGVAVQAEAGTTLGDLAPPGIPIRFDCGGKGVCGQCRVIAEPAAHLSPPSQAETESLGPDVLARSVRLACQARILGPVTVTLPGESADSPEVRGKDGLTGIFAPDPMVQRLVLPPAPAPPAPAGSSGCLVSDLCRRALQATGRRVFFRDGDALGQLSRLDEPRAALTLVSHRQKGVTAVFRGCRPQTLGLAVDLGTTTVAAYLCALDSGRVLASAAALNPQRRFGADVISRISFTATRKNGLQTLQALIVATLNDLSDRCLEQAGARRESVDELSVVGNTTMQQILAALEIRGLGASPFLPVVRTPLDLRARALGLDFNPGTNVHLFPVASGFVGGDTLAAVLADDLQARETAGLVIDIGTNGELVLGGRGGLWAASCATGPALEGAHIAAGMRAVAGAIHRVAIDPQRGAIVPQVLGQEDGARPRGLCGSGIIDAVAAMRRCGALLPDGRLRGGMPGVVCDEQGIGRRFVLVSAAKSATGRDIALSLADIRQIQLAKGALRAGITLLMRRAGLERVARTTLTGAFGARFDWRSAVAIGMLPPVAVAGEVLVRENLAGVGAVMALMDRRARARVRALARSITVVELAHEPDFQARFVQATQFPPLDASGWPVTAPP